MLSGEPLLNKEEPVISLTGNQRFVLTTKLPFRNRDGKVIGLVGIGHDITERKRAEETIASERQLLRTLIDLLPETIYIKDLDSRFQVVNQSLAKRFGKDTPSQIVGLSDVDFFPAELAAEFHAEEQKVIAGEPLINQENTMVSSDGREHTVLTTKLPFRDSQGRICGLVGIGYDITERKRAEEAVRESEEKFSKVFQNAPVLIAVTDLADGTCLDVNAEALYVSGFNREEVVGRTEAELGWITPADRARLLHELQEHGRVSGLEMTFQDKDGRWLYGLVSGEQISIRGRPCLLTVTVDITERKRAEAALQESQALYHSLVEQLPAGVFRKDQEGRYVLVNPEFCQLKGMKAEEFLGKTPREVAAAEVAKQGEMGLATKYAAAGAEHHEQIMQTGKPIELVEEYVYADGRKQFLHVIKLPVIGSDGKIIGTQGIQFDITERKQAEQAIEQAFQRQQGISRLHESLLESRPVRDKLQFVTETIVRLFDADFCRIWLTGPGDLCEQGCMHAQVTEGPHACRRRELCLHLLASAGRYTHLDGPGHRRVPFGAYKIGGIAAGKEAKFLINNVQQDPLVHDREWAKELGLVSFAGYRLQSPGGAPLGVLALFAKRPLTAQEDLLLEGLSNATTSVLLTQLAEDETRRELAERKRAEDALEKSARELQERNDELARFTYTASHDLKSPLVTIKAFLGYLEQDTRNQDAAGMKKDLEYIYTAADKMGRLLEELLNLARVGHKMNPPEEVPLQAVVKEALALVAGGIAERGVEVVATQEPATLFGDRTRLVEVFQNLVDNAIKFMGDQQKPRVEIGVETAGDEKVFFVRDNGVGIEPQYQHKVFGLFEKYDPAAKGTGIGLALVKRIVEVHGGKIWVESAGIGHGATFRFTLAKNQPHPAQP